jgi:uncharacterized membrane protein
LKRLRRRKRKLNENLRKIIKTGSIIAIALGCVGLYIGGGSEGYTIEIVSSVFAGIGLITSLIKK